MSPRSIKRPVSELRDELGPEILPRQLRILERVAARLDDERPAPSAAFRADLLDGATAVNADDSTGPPAAWRLGAAVCLASGLVLLAVVALLGL